MGAQAFDARPVDFANSSIRLKGDASRRVHAELAAEDLTCVSVGRG
jgi:hypothetical protein